MRSAGRLRTVSLRRRVTALSMLVLAAVLVLVGVLTDVVFATQTRAHLHDELTVRAALADRLVTEGLPTPEVVRRVEAPGIRAVVVAADGAVYDGGEPERAPGPPWRQGPGDYTGRDGWGDGSGAGPGRSDQVLQQPLVNGARLTLVADGAQVTAAQRLLRRTLLLLSIAALAVAGVVTLLTTRVALAPLDAMTALARSITRGDRGRRLAPSRTDTELGRTASAFDAMLDELEGAEASARASEARTRQFVADAAHELRTPLAGVQAAAEAAIAPGLDAEERDRLHLLLLRESHRAGRLVDDLLALARIDAGIELRHEPVDLLELARAEAERVRLLAPNRTVEVRGDSAVVPGDPARLGQVLGNLLDNARRYTPSGGRITVGVSVRGAATLLVTDTGPGVPPADRERIFDRLVQLDEARTADGGGAGLGLAIARGIARAHGGDLRCVDPPDGTGAAFALILPIS
ncbi:MAG TPA: HAMP domain-containing sensor histidine kinase [Pseudonocardia sp.]|nr:HAMP domain-containing sensor histidine kinase [Pseudonocardia sp.]